MSGSSGFRWRRWWRLTHSYGTVPEVWPHLFVAAITARDGMISEDKRTLENTLDHV